MQLQKNKKKFSTNQKGAKVVSLYPSMTIARPYEPHIVDVEIYADDVIKFNSLMETTAEANEQFIEDWYFNSNEF